MEIRVAASDKGDAVRTILHEMSHDAAVAYLGDDHTDEDAFAALQGYGLSVLVQPHHRPTVADLWVRPPEGVLAFLTDWMTACGGAL
jgi:trehalose-phosphatase